jgi:hypothetical protein
LLLKKSIPIVFTVVTEEKFIIRGKLYFYLVCHGRDDANGEREEEGQAGRQQHSPVRELQLPPNPSQVNTERPSTSASITWNHHCGTMA